MSALLRTKIRSPQLALEFDLTCQAVLNRHDLEIEKIRLSVWGVTDDAKPQTKRGAKSASAVERLASEAGANGLYRGTKSRKQTMTRDDIMRNYKK